MASILPGYEYDIFISYRQKDNKQDGWVTEFIETLKNEIEATFKEDISIYFDENPHDGLLETHQVDESLKKKLKCLILIPIVSQTYCDSKCFAWQKEFIAFRDIASDDQFGLNVDLPNGNISSRILPIRIHDLDKDDITLFEKEIGGVMRAIDFIYTEPGVNRPLRPNEEHPESNLHKTVYRNQINKIANGIKEVISGLKDAELTAKRAPEEEVSTPTEQKKTPLGTELKRRNILRVSLSYLLTAVLFWKGTEIIVGLMDLPSSTMQLVTLMLILFFPIAISFAWLYEISPDGFIRTSSKEAQHNPFSSAQKKPLTSNTFIGTLLLTVAVLYFFFPHKSESTIDYDNSEKSIAVLPFVNMSNDPEQEFFSDGISEELINALAKLPDLKVSGRTSSFSFKGKNQNMEEIGKQLGVKTILEGSVRKSGTTLRITAQLINAKDGFHLWTETYDRELKDIFAVQDEITAAIVDALKIHLVNEEAITKSQSINIEAYSTYLKARQKLASRGLNNLIESGALFNQVIALDSTYAPAYSGLGRVLSLLINYSAGDLTFNNSFGLATEAANNALALDPNNGEAYSVLGTVKSWHDWDWKGAESDIKKSLALNPNDAETYNFAGDFYRIVCHPVALEMELKAVELDPLHAINHWDLANVYAQMEDWENTVKYTRNALQLNSSLIILSYPKMVDPYNKLGYIKELENVFENLDTTGIEKTYLLAVKTVFALAKGENDLALENIQSLESFGELGTYSSCFIADYYLSLEMYNKAAYWLEKAYQNRDIFLVFEPAIILPEHVPNNQALQAALDKPELNALYEIRRRNLKLGSDNP